MCALGIYLKSLQAQIEAGDQPIPQEGGGPVPQPDGHSSED
jgi:hypothetical protein